MGIISIKDVMSFILDQFPEEVTNVLGEPYRGMSFRICLRNSTVLKLSKEHFITNFYSKCVQPYLLGC